MSRILNNISPFSETITSLNHAQIDFILEMYAKDNPKDYRFIRGDQLDEADQTQVLARWEAVLIDKAKSEFWKRFMPSEAVLKRAAEITNANFALTKAAAGMVKR